MSRKCSLGVFCVLVLTVVHCVSAATLWISAEQAKYLSPTMVLGGKTGLQEENALGDFLVPTVTSTADKPDRVSVRFVGSVSWGEDSRRSPSRRVR